MANSGKGALDRIRRAQMLPMLGGEIVEREQRLAILDQTFGGFLVLDAPGLDKCIERGERLVFGFSHPNFLQRPLGFCLLALGKLFKTLAVLCTQQRWPRVFGHTSSIACQKPIAPSAIA